MLKLTTEDYYTLKGKAKNAGISMSEFVRKVLEKGNVIERLTFEQADFIRKLCGMANNKILKLLFGPVTKGHLRGI